MGSDAHPPTTDEHSRSPGGARSTSRATRSPGAGRMALVILLAVLGAVGMVFVGTALVFRLRVLDAETYQAALVEANAYDRVYTEVFADPELAELTQWLLGDLDVPPALAAQASAMSTNVVRLVVPPDRIQAGLEAVIDEVVAYLRGDSAQLEPGVVIDSLPGRIDVAAVIAARRMLASAVDRAAFSLEVYHDDIVGFIDELADGRLPDVVPVVGGTTFEPEDVIEAILAATGTGDDEEIRQEVTARVLVGDERNALIVAATATVSARADVVAAELRDAEPDQVLDVVELIAQRAEAPAERVIERFDAARDAARWFGPAAIAAVGAIIVLALAGAALLDRHRLRRIGLVIASSIAVAAVGQVVVWRLIGSALASPLSAATETGPDTWNLPTGVRSLLRDVAASIDDRVSGLVLRTVLMLLAVGVALVAGCALPRVRVRVARHALAAAALIVAAVGVAALADSTLGSTAERACNGHADLCDRAYDDVVYAATHNSMSSPDVVRVWPEHDGDIRAQLDAGVRALLIDTHYWPPVASAAELVARHDPSTSALPEVVAAAVYDSLGTLAEGRPGTFLCHNHCAFGAIEFVDALGLIHEFLEENPNEVVTLIIQDAITADDTASAMDAAGLTSYLYPHGADRSWPTLGELIDRGQRLVVFAEEEGQPPDWYANAFEEMQETPFLVTDPDRFTCEPNRGTADATLFLLNHWVQRVAPDPVDATIVNEYDFLLDRARQCERERGLVPNYIAVNFFSIGDVFAVVDSLNGLG